MRAIHWAMAREVLSFVLAFMALVMVLHLCTGCSSKEPPPPQVVEKATTYESALIICNELATSLIASIECENRVRVRYGRPLRPLPKDGGPDAS